MDLSNLYFDGISVFTLYTTHWICMFDNSKYTQLNIEFQFFYFATAHAIDSNWYKHRIINLQTWQQQKENTSE